MKNRWMVIGVAGISVLLGGATAAAHSYNPIKWIRKGPSPTASEQLAANKEQEKKLSQQLQAVLPPRTSLKDACAGFRSLNDCVASLHVSHNLSIKFNCLKWDVTGAKPAGDVKTCARGHQGRVLVRVSHRFSLRKGGLRSALLSCPNAKPRLSKRK